MSQSVIWCLWSTARARDGALNYEGRAPARFSLVSAFGTEQTIRVGPGESSPTSPVTAQADGRHSPKRARYGAHLDPETAAMRGIASPPLGYWRPIYPMLPQRSLV